MSSRRNYAVILAGGMGERFWPMSTSKRPKQFLSLVGEGTLLAQAVDRLEGLIDPHDVFVITNQDYVEVTAEAAPALDPAKIIGEPVGRDTAPAVALACALVKKIDPEAAFCILTADHVIGDLDLFRATLREGFRIAREKDALVTIGIHPTEPATGYGYIETGAEVEEADGIPFMEAVRFVEKPDRETAEGYLASGRFFWNSGMFIWTAATLERALRAHHPPLGAMMDELEPAIGTDAFPQALAAAYDRVEKISVDFAIMEKADNIITAKGTFAWDDVGAWPALEHHFSATGEGNIAIGDCRVVDSANNLVVSPDRLTALIGVEDLVVVQTDRATLICPKDRAQDVKRMVQHLQETGGYEDLLDMARHLGIDHGEKRIGFALSDPSGVIATPHSVYTYTGQKAALREVVRLCEEKQVEQIVIGWPVNMDGSVGPTAEAVAAFEAKLRNRTSIPIARWDERLTSKSAEQVLIAADVRRARRKQVIDKMAAQLLLQAYLDAQGGGPDG